MTEQTKAKETKNTATSAEYLNSRNFSKIREEGLLGQHGESILDHLKANPTARVLDAGCGNGAALCQLKKVFPKAEYSGLDESPLKADAKEFKFHHQKLEELVVKEDERYDIIYSAAVFHYVHDLKTALLNIAKALRPDGIAYIGIEPFYFGPHGAEIFANSKFFSWSKDQAGNLKTIVIKGGIDQTEIESFMAGFTAYTLPTVLLSNLHLFKNGPPGHMVPITCCYTNKEKQKILTDNSLHIAPTHQNVITWELLEFLQMNTYNPLGPPGAGRPNYRPYKFAAPRVYLKKANLNEKALVQFLIDPNNYPPEWLQPGWKPSKTYKTMLGYVEKTTGVKRPDLTKAQSTAAKLVLPTPISSSSVGSAVAGSVSASSASLSRSVVTGNRHGSFAHSDKVGVPEAKGIGGTPSTAHASQAATLSGDESAAGSASTAAPEDTLGFGS